MDDEIRARESDGMSARSVWPLVLVLTGCGSGPITADGETATGTGGTETGSETGPDALACMDEQGLVPGVLRLEPVEDRAWLLEHGVERELELPSVGGENISLVADVAGDFIAIARNDGPFATPHASLNLYSRSSGELLSTRELDGTSLWQLWVAPDGLVSGTLSGSLQGEIGFVDVGALSLLASVRPFAAPAMGRVVAVEIEGEGVPGRPGWLALADQSWQEAEPAPLLNYEVFTAQDEHTLEYIALVDGAPAFVTATPEQSESLELPVMLLDGQSLSFRGRAGDYRLFGRSDANGPIDHVLVDVGLGEAIHVDPEPPPGWSFFDCYARNTAVDGGGRIYFELRDQTSARTWMFEPQTDSWSPLGLPLGLVDDMEISSSSRDVLLVRGMAQFNTYCPPTEWVDTPADALVGDSVQLLRTAPERSWVLANVWQVLIDGEQRCAAYLGESGWEVRAIDGSEAVRSVDAGVGNWLWLD
jgi:hypothetical protein